MLKQLFTHKSEESNKNFITGLIHLIINNIQEDQNLMKLEGRDSKGVSSIFQMMSTQQFLKKVQFLQKFSSFIPRFEVCQEFQIKLCKLIKIVISCNDPDLEQALVEGKYLDFV